jgi:hypothetical protein
MQPSQYEHTNAIDAMPTFIDESGDTGPNPDPKNCYFHLAAVWVPSHDVAEAFRDNVRSLRQQLKIRRDYEFKFSKTWNYPSYRRAFFEAAMQHEFRFAVSSIDKRDKDWCNAAGEVFHWASAVYLASSLRDTYIEAQQTLINAGSKSPLRDVVVVDDNDDSNFLKIVRTAFGGLGAACKPPLHLIGKVRFRGSGPDELVQLADMVCGAYSAFIGEKEEKDRWYEMIASRDVAAAPTTDMA